MFFFSHPTAAYSDDNGNPITNISTDFENPTTPINGDSPTRSKSVSPHKHGGMRRPRKNNTMKFNQSNRESNNLGVFYFKHSDTEPETGNGAPNNANDWSSQDANSEILSEDDQWVYSNGDDINGNAELNETDDTNGNVTQIYVDGTTIDTVDCPPRMSQVSIFIILIGNSLKILRKLFILNFHSFLIVLDIGSHDNWCIKLNTQSNLGSRRNNREYSMNNFNQFTVKLTKTPFSIPVFQGNDTTIGDRS